MSIPWGCEIVWCALIPKNVRNNSIIQKIICGAIYSKPDSRFKTVLLDHIGDTYNLLSTQNKKDFTGYLPVIQMS